MERINIFHLRLYTFWAFAVRHKEIGYMGFPFDRIKRFSQIEINEIWFKGGEGRGREGLLPENSIYYEIGINSNTKFSP